MCRGGGLAKMREILGERMELEVVFDEKALDLLCEASGGHPRILMTLVRNACSYVQSAFPNPSTATQRAGDRSPGQRIQPLHSRGPFSAVGPGASRQAMKNDDRSPPHAA